MKEMQEALMKYLASIKANLGDTMLMILTLETEEQMIEMLKYISENRPIDIVEIYNVACEIAEKTSSMSSLSQKSEAEDYFKKLIAENNNAKVTSVHTCLGFGLEEGNRRYMTDEPIIISFSNDQCWKIEYYFIDGLEVNIRPLMDYEKRFMKTDSRYDCFNNTVDVHNFDPKDRAIHKHQISLEYDSIIDVKINSVTNEYEKWVDGNLETVQPTDETFSNITFVMKNGNTFTIFPFDATDDGYMGLYSKEANEREEILDK